MNTEDRVVGTWQLIRTSTCRPAAEVAVQEKRALALKHGIGEAIQMANTEPMQEVKPAKAIMDWVFRGVKPATD